MKLQKETKPAISHGKWYDDACGTALALEVLGERWSMLVVRELMLGPRRFSDLRAALPGISAKVLTERLETLATWGVLEKAQLPPPAAAQVYELTEWGYSADRAINELGRWAARSCHHNPDLPLSAASLMASMRTMQLPALADAPDMTIGIEIGGEAYRAAIRSGALVTEKCREVQGDAVFRAASARPVAGALYADVPLAALEDEAGLVVEGDRSVAERFLALFALPPKIDSPRA
ncbi:winged helix-turn-helix transcriptional regulator [Aurantiacibacter poecillastricola]|uniref:winged helix-turn-helix transcriptional regulator n=1 Tax=Aurantiacibacter poecillastricola TaxID=3064385 RepID=UPI00273DDA0A|nr:helix-turn-helix domain-containing protein [Aurantiacibacter sp. 219JJ12-13]MDP5262522.1 helix-turn-helix domain-containing protein [Aurantiacibacter sp. 219JJ12-13]